MKPDDKVTRIIDSPEPEEWVQVLSAWSKPDFSEPLKNLTQSTGREKFGQLCSLFGEKLNAARSPRSRLQLEKLILEWLYDFIRLNVKRGRIFDLREVLRIESADCLGYAKLFTVLGRLCSLDLGIVEVLIDNRGRNVPHTATLVRLADGQRQFVDFWYGSRDVRHQRLGLQIKEAGRWRIGDIDYRNFAEAEDITYLPARCVDAITLYIEGNRCLKEGAYSQAVEKYSQAIRWYPQNARAFYNRAIAYEKLGKKEKAEADYQRALQDEDARTRTLATQPQEIVSLIDLDEKFIPELDQQIYLLRAGFITGRRVSPAGIARKLGLSQDEVEAILSFTFRLVGPDDDGEYRGRGHAAGSQNEGV